MSIQDIKFNTTDMYSIALQTLTSAGSADKIFTWNDWTEWPAGSGNFNGFWDDGTGEPSTYTFSQGEALWVQGVEGDAMQTAGEVAKSDLVFELITGNVLVGNAFPTEVAVNDIIATASDIYSIALQTLTPAGSADKIFTWNDWTEWPAGSGNFNGFWDDGSGEPTTYKVAPGEALWVQGIDGATLIIPAPEFN